jgi:hypothetical protein
VNDGPRFLVELRAEGPGPPAIIRLRAWLKTALRCHGLRAMSVQEVPADPLLAEVQAPAPKPAGPEPRGS